MTDEGDGEKVKKVEYKGKFYTLPELAESHDLKICTLYGRLRRGLSIEDALTIPVRPQAQPVEYDGTVYESKVALARELGCDEKRFYRIGKEYDSIEDALPKQNHTKKKKVKNNVRVR